ncbi:MAG: amidohydrolase family protein, partial [Actinobacteria bacterium]|nr:amidohydrolase family protein [Actinomycetota bacterium]
EPLSPVVREAIRRARAACDENARRTGMSRRQFLLSLCGAATTLLALDACTIEAARHRGISETGGRYLIPPEATVEPSPAEEAVGGEEFVFDVQGHLLEYDLNPATREASYFGAVFPQRDCGDADPRECFSMNHFMEEMFLKSDTTMVALSALPIAPEGSPLSTEIMDETRRVAEGLCSDERVLLHGQAIPNVGPLQANLEAMEATVRRYPIAAWKTFTHYPDLWERSGNAWWLDDHEAGVPQVGEAFIRKAVELGVPRICIHKGFSRDSRFASPVDVGPAARKHPEASFLIYHSGYESGTAEGPYSTATTGVGVNRLIASLRKAGVGPNENVYAELGSTWWNVMRDPTSAAHVLGKLLKYVGEDNVVWGTDCLFYGSPQDQIQAFRAFSITDAFQDRFGYPKLTKEIKRKVLGANAARVYGVDPVTVPCAFTPKELAEIRRSLPGKTRTYGPTSMPEVRAFIEHHRGWP